MLARQIAIGLGIAVAFQLLIHNSLSTLDPPPKRRTIATVTATLYQGDRPVAPERRGEYEERRAEQQEQDRLYDVAAREFARRSVIASIALGIAAILAGAYLATQFIGVGLIFAGIFTVTWSCWNYWG